MTKGFTARFFDALVESRMRQADAITRRHLRTAGINPDDVMRRGEGPARG